MARGMSIHIGLNHVNPAAYSGWDGALAGCINDATDMKAIADGLGYSPSLLLTDSQATCARVTCEIGMAAQQLTTGDTLLLTYSGHGGQVPDVNGDEPDGQNETWVLWDRQLIDDELAALWCRFTAGVRIFMLSDSCHSGTVLRMLATYSDLSQKMLMAKEVPTAAEIATLNSLGAALRLDQTREVPLLSAAGSVPAGSREVYASAGMLMSRSGNGGSGSYGSTSPTSPSNSGGGSVAIAEPPAAGGAATGLAPEIPPAVRLAQVPPLQSFRGMPPDVRTVVNQQRDAENAAAQFIAGPSSATRGQIGASVLLISGCEDWQTSLDGARNGLFTEKLKQVWSNGQFSGNYQSFLTEIRSRMPASQTPNLATTGATNPAFEAEKPFTIGTGGAPTPTPTPPTPTPTGTRPTLRYGMSGPDVVYLQQRLTQQGFTLVADGIFGDNTHARVVEFQRAKGLSADGVVGQMTWQALEGGSTPTPTPPTPPSPTPTPPTPTPPSTTRPQLQRGSRGPDVVYLQQRLQAFGHMLVADGDFGAKTEAAVRSFQNSNGLTADGVVGPRTWAALG